MTRRCGVPIDKVIRVEGGEKFDPALKRYVPYTQPRHVWSGCRAFAMRGLDCCWHHGGRLVERLGRAS